MIITDKNNNLINKLATGEEQFSDQVAIAPNGNVWVTHTANKILTILSSHSNESSDCNYITIAQQITIIIVLVASQFFCKVNVYV